MSNRNIHDQNPAEVAGIDDEELVGPGRYPLRIQPAAALQPGKRDARRLLRLWFVRKSFYWMFFLGWAVGGIAAAVRHERPELDVTGADPAWLLVVVALAMRFIVGWVALGLAFPLALAHEPNLTPRTNFGARIGVFFDRLNLARGFRALRWTHHVRQVAQHRLGDEGRRLGRLDPILDVVNIAAGVIGVLTTIIVAVIVGD